MAAKQMKFDTDARAEIASGLSQLARAGIQLKRVEAENRSGLTHGNLMGRSYPIHGWFRGPVVKLHISAYRMLSGGR